jgi:hypothetical protein
MRRLKLFLCIFGVAAAFLAGYGAAGKAYPAGGVHGRGEYNGYRTNIDDSSGSYVLRQVYWGEAIRPNVEGDAEEFISFILNTKLDVDGNGSGTNQDKRGATFIIQTMIGATTSQRPNRPTQAQIDEWKRRVRYSAARGWISWRVNYSFQINTMYQATNGGANPDDDAFYDESDTKPSILFRNSAGSVVYAIKWECANPVGNGSLGPIPDDVTNFDMDANLISRVNGVNSATAEAGDTITFEYNARNNGPGAATPITCQTWRHNYTGYRAPPADVDAGSSAGPPMGCPGTFTAGQTRQITETVTATANSTICRFMRVTPNSPAGGFARDVACVTVYTKPYFRVYNGDVSSGASFTPCTPALPAGEGRIQAFNRGAAAGYAGSGAEGAVMAYRDIIDFVSANMRGAAPQEPKGLTFANNAAAAVYGGNFGAGTCIPDYWSVSSSPGAVVNNVGAGSFTQGGTSLGPGVKRDVFVDGDVVITGNIVYTGNWALDMTANTIPSFRLIVRNGNIYVRDTVTQLDGVYVAIPRADGTKGLIYTCALGAGVPTEAQVANGCKQQLRVNGVFIAQGVKLLRTPNSLNNSVAGESSAASRAGEIFTYTPEVWLANPQFRLPVSGDYDAITTLPPVL